MGQPDDRSQGFAATWSHRAGNEEGEKICGLLFISVDFRMPFVEVLQGSDNLETSPASERVAAAWSECEGGPICHGVRVDAEWKHQ